VACVDPATIGPSPSDFYEGPTAIDAVALSCSADQGEWDMAVDTVGWTAGGDFAWTADGLYLEEHSLLSEEADFYGGWDHLEAEVGITADPRNAGGGSTALFCDTPTRQTLRGYLVIYHPDTEEPVDCRTWEAASGGPAFDWEAAGYPPCSEVVVLAF